MIPNIDFEKIKQKLIYAEGNINKLDKLKDLTEEEFINDFRNIDSAKYLLQVTIETMLDISAHIIARNRWGKPESNKEYFEIMADKDIIRKGDIETYSSMAKFRNRIVHMYYAIDNHVIYEIVKSNLKDLKKFINDVGQKL